jgi:hypothetical protein
VLNVAEAALFYSDGLVEAHDPKGEMFGFPRLRELVAEHGEARSLEEALLEELYSFVGEGWEQEDDITLLTLRRSPTRSSESSVHANFGLATTKGEAQMAEQRVPNLEQMDEQQAHHLLTELFSRLSAEAEHQLRHR